MNSGFELVPDIIRKICMKEVSDLDSVKKALALMTRCGHNPKTYWMEPLQYCQAFSRLFQSLLPLEDKGNEAFLREHRYDFSRTIENCQRMLAEIRKKDGDSPPVLDDYRDDSNPYILSQYLHAYQVLVYYYTNTERFKHAIRECVADVKENYGRVLASENAKELLAKEHYVDTYSDPAIEAYGAPLKIVALNIASLGGQYSPDAVKEFLDDYYSFLSF